MTAISSDPTKLATYFLLHGEPANSPTIKNDSVGNGLFVSRHVSIQEFDLVDLRNRKFARLFGFPVISQAKAIEPPIQKGSKISFKSQVDDLSEVETAILPLLAGSFVLITQAPLEQFLYLDHAGAMPIVFDAVLKRAGTSANVMLDDNAYQDRFERDLYQKLVDSKRQYGWSWIPGTLTAHRGIKRLLPNHKLCLASWGVTRFWPKPSDLDPERKTEEIVRDVGSHLRNFVSSVASSHRVSVALTAGNDSRLVLAAAKDVKNEIDSFTMTAARVGRDASIAAGLSKAFGFRHKAISIVDASHKEELNWDRAVGHCVHEANRKYHPTLLKLTEADFILSGAYGEVGRCFFYKYDTATVLDNRISARLIMRKMALPDLPEVFEDVTQWLNSISKLSNSAILDLAALELRCGSWIGAQRPAQSAVKHTLYPFAQRPILTAFLEAKPKDKSENKLFLQIIKSLWPDLLNVPINRYGDHRDHLEKLSKFLDLRKLSIHLKKRLANLSRS